MEPISLEAARKDGFEPCTYSPFLQDKQVRAHVDFITEMGESGISLFFRGETSGERFYAVLKFSPPATKKTTGQPHLCRIFNGMTCEIYR